MDTIFERLRRFIPSPGLIRREMRLLAIILGTMLVLSLFVTGLIVLESFLWRALSYYVSLVFFVLASLALMQWALSPAELQSLIRQEMDKGASPLIPITIAPVLYFLSFVLLSRGAWIVKGSTMFEQLPAHPTMVTWVLYGFDQFARVVLFDLPESFDFSLSQVEHAKTFWMSMMVFTFRFTLSLSGLKVVIGAARGVAIERRRRGITDPQSLL